MPHHKPHPGQPLGTREQQVLAGMARGLSNQAIAVELGVGLEAVKTYARQVFVKLGVGTRLDAVAAGRRLGLVAGRCPMCGSRPAPVVAQRPPPDVPESLDGPVSPWKPSGPPEPRIRRQRPPQARTARKETPP